MFSEHPVLCEQFVSKTGSDIIDHKAFSLCNVGTMLLFLQLLSLCGRLIHFFIKP